MSISIVSKMSEKMKTLKGYSFLFSELVKRDFKQKYKRTVLGMAWSVLSPLLTLLVMRLVFTEFFGHDTPYYTTYLFSGNIVMSYYREATRGGMNSLTGNARIITKVNIPKYLFLLSKNVSALVNFGLTIVVYFLFCAIDGIPFGFRMVALIYPIVCLTILNIGAGLILSAMYVFFRDTQYLYDVFLTLLTYLSAIFYQVNRFSPKIQKLFLANPIYCIIKYFRVVVIDGNIPSLTFHMLCAFYAIMLLVIGMVVYKKNDYKFVYYF